MNKRRLIAVGVLGLLVGLVIGRTTAPETGTAPSQTPDDPVQSSPLATAIEFAEAVRLLPDTDAYVAAIEPLTHPSFKSEAIQEGERSSEFLIESYGNSVQSVFAPVRYRMNGSGASTSIELWGSTIVGSARNGPEASYLIATITLEESDGTWLVTGHTSTSDSTSQEPPANFEPIP